MKKDDLTKKSPEELKKHMNQLKLDIANKMKERVIGESTNHHDVENLRRELARVLTILTIKEGVK